MIVNLRDFYLLNLWRILSGGLGWSSRIVMRNFGGDMIWVETDCLIIYTVIDTLLLKIAY